MATMREEYAALVKAAEALNATKDTWGEEDHIKAADMATKINEMRERLKAAEDASEIMHAFTLEAGKKHVPTSGAKSLGAHAAAHIKDAGGISAVRTAQVNVPEFKAGEIVRDESKLAGYNLDVRPSILPYVPEATVPSLFANVNTNQAGVEFLRWTFTGDPAAIKDGDEKPPLTGDYVRDSATLTEIGAHIIISEAMLEDEEALEAKINEQLARRLAIVEQTELLTGNGTAPHLAGLVNTPGIQAGTAADAAELIDAILKAQADIEEVTGLAADAIVINPADWYTLRTAKDANGQYLFGGPAYAPYGNGVVDVAANPWGLRLVRSSAIAQGTVLVGAFNDGATVYRKGGVRIAATNAHAETFTHDLVTIRAFERVGLVVEYPQAFVNITLGGE